MSNVKNFFEEKLVTLNLQKTKLIAYSCYAKHYNKISIKSNTEDSEIEYVFSALYKDKHCH